METSMPSACTSSRSSCSISSDSASFRLVLGDGSAKYCGWTLLCTHHFGAGKMLKTRNASAVKHLCKHIDPVRFQSDTQRSFRYFGFNLCGVELPNPGLNPWLKIEDSFFSFFGTPKGNEPFLFLLVQWVGNDRARVLFE